jgi:hypothetical protein
MSSGAAAVGQAGEPVAHAGRGGALERHDGASISIWGAGRSGTHHQSRSTAEVGQRMGIGGSGHRRLGRGAGQSSSETC